ncbi:site-specific recombinase, partial [Vibrio vulnificus]
MPKSKSKAKSLSSSQVRKVLKQCLLMQNAELKRVV